MATDHPDESRRAEPMTRSISPSPDATDKGTKFDDLMRSLRRGGLNCELSEKITQLVKQVHDTGRGGKLILTLNVKRPKGARRQVEIADTVKLELPKMDAEPTFMFANEHGELVKDDPDQKDIPFGKGAVVDVTADETAKPAALDVSKTG